MATKVSEASITCSICLGRYRNPRILPCLHSFCEDCLISYAAKGTPSMTCPLCKEEIEIPGGDVTKFKHDFRLQGQVDDATNYEKLAIGSGPKLECNCCDDGQEAIGRCLDCEQFLCQFGMKSHDKIRGLQNHHVFTLEELRSGKIEMKSGQRKHRMCISHADEKARYYCHTCHDFICRECTVLDHPKPDHEYTSVADAAKKYKDEIQNKMADIAKFRDDCKEVALKKMVDIDVESAAAVTEVRNEAHKLRARIDKKEKERLDVIERLRQRRNETIKGYVKELENIQERADHVNDKVDEIIGSTNDEEFLSLFSTLGLKMEQLHEKTPKNIKIDGAYMAYNQLTEQNVEMGKLEIPEIAEWDVTLCKGQNDEDILEDKQFVRATLHQKLDLVCLLQKRSTMTLVVIFTESGDLKHSFEVEPVEANCTENNSETWPSDLCTMPDGNIAVFKYYEIDIYKTTGSLEKRIDTQVCKRMVYTTKMKDLPQAIDSESKDVNDNSAKQTNITVPNFPTTDSKCANKSNDSSLYNNNTIGSLRFINFQNEQHFLASFYHHQFIGFYNISSGDLRKSIDVDFQPDSLTVVDEDSFLVASNYKIFHMNVKGEYMKTIMVPAESEMIEPIAVSFDAATAQIYVLASDYEAEENSEDDGEGESDEDDEDEDDEDDDEHQTRYAVLQYSSSGVYLGCISSKVEHPADMRMIGSNKLLIADTESLKILTRS